MGERQIFPEQTNTTYTDSVRCDEFISIIGKTKLLGK